MFKEIDKQFLISLDKWKKKSEKFEIESIDSHIESGDFIDEDLGINPKLFAVAFQHIVKDRLWEFFSDLREPLIKCKSPIEQLMFFSLNIAARGQGDQIQYIIDGKKKLPIRAPHIVEIEPQAKILNYNVDFLVSHVIIDYLNSEYLEFRETIIIECDGHEFHEKTKMQVSADKKRDRELLKEGYKVFRYSGSDIWNDTFSCADEILTYLSEKCLTNRRKRLIYRVHNKAPVF